jgi:hypothetical protein
MRSGSTPKALDSGSGVGVRAAAARACEVPRTVAFGAAAGAVAEQAVSSPARTALANHDQFQRFAYGTAG